MADFTETNIGNAMAEWQKAASFNAYWTYSFINNSAFYSMIPAYYRPFMQRFVQNWSWWADGWVPYFHSADSGLLSSRIGVSIVDRISRKVVGGRIMFKNTKKESTSEIKNPSKAAIEEWAEEINFEKTIKKLANYTAALGTSLLKLNLNEDGQLWADAVRFDRFLPSVDAGTGKIREVKCFLMTEVDMDNREMTLSYHLIEKRYYGDYTKVNGEVIKNAPIVEYNIYRNIGSITQGTFTNSGFGSGEQILFKTLPKNIRKAILANYGYLEFDQPILLPFKDLGCQLVTWTEGVSGIPQLPFGDSVLANILSYLQEWDYSMSAMATDMYLGRGRVLVPNGIVSPNGSTAPMASQNAGLDSMLLFKVPAMSPEEQKPTPIQFDLRPEEWAKIRNILVENMAINIGISPSTLAAFLADSTPRTAREVSTEENETIAYVADKRSILETPINKILNTVRMFYGCADTVAIRWSQAGMSNPYMTAEITSLKLQNGSISKEDALRDQNPDDDDDQIIEKLARIQKDTEAASFGQLDFNEENYDSKEFESADTPT